MSWKMRKIWNKKTLEWKRKTFSQNQPDYHKISLAREKGYNIIHEIWRESEFITDDKKRDKEAVMPAHLPSPILYACRSVPA